VKCFYTRGCGVRGYSGFYSLLGMCSSHSLLSGACGHKLLHIAVISGAGMFFKASLPLCGVTQRR
jgi:hypothetical protein